MFILRHFGLALFHIVTRNLNGIICKLFLRIFLEKFPPKRLLRFKFRSTLKVGGKWIYFLTIKRNKISLVNLRSCTKGVSRQGKYTRTYSPHQELLTIQQQTLGGFAGNVPVFLFVSKIYNTHQWTSFQG